jgi:hypothetical protein
LFQAFFEKIKTTGVSQSFLDEISSNRNRFNLIYFLKMTRSSSIDAGYDEMFESSIVELSPAQNTLVDSEATRAVFGAKPLQPGGEYTYTFELVAQTPLTVFDNAFIQKTDTTSFNTFKIAMSTFFDSIGLPKINLPPSSEQEPKKLTDAIANLPPIAKQGLEYNVVAEANVKISKVTIRQEAGIRVVAWTLVGNASQVDHFVITASVNGDSYSIDTIPGYAGQGGLYSVADTHTIGQLGSLSYTVFAIGLDMSTIATSVSPTIILDLVEEFEVAVKTQAQPSRNKR